MAARESDAVDSGELWLPGRVESPPIRVRAQRQQHRDWQDLTPLMRRTVKALLAPVSGRERLWMSPRLRSLSPAQRVKLIYELENLATRLT